MEGEDNLVYIFEYDDVPAGQVRFSITEDYSTIGISISERFRGRGLAHNSLKIAVGEYFKIYKLPILAHIKKTNTASVKSFERAGFKFFKDKMIDGIDSFVFIKRID